jgi:hypothetical protein
MPNYVRLEFPPGVYRNGTKYQAKGRWYESNLVRWTEGAMQPVGGWTSVLDSNDAALDLTDPVRGLFGWRSNAQAPYLALGTYNKAYAFAGGVLTDITPAGFTAGGEGAASTAGQYGNAAYGQGAYGQGSGFTGGTIVEANSWQFDNFGEHLIACCYSDGIIYEWDLNVANNLVDVTTSPTTANSLSPVSCKGVFVSPERFVVALAGQGQNVGIEDADADGRRVIWSDQEDAGEWDPRVAGSQAGDFLLPGAGQIMCGARNRTESLIWTDVDLFAMRYIGGTLIYSFAQVGANCGIISRRAHAEVDGRSYWMGHRGFFVYDGFAQPLSCEIADEIFTNLNEYESSRVCAWSVNEFHEIWFSYPANGSSENNRVVVYNYLENHWSGPWGIGEGTVLVRTDGIDRSVFGHPVTADSEGGIFFHESGTGMLAEDGATTLVPSAESGPFEVGQGDRLVTINRYIPDENSYGDVDFALYAGMYPTDSTEDDQDSAQSDITIGEITDTRLTGRQIRIGIRQVTADWRFGVPRLEVINRGRR